MILYIGIGETVSSCARRKDEFDLTFPVLSDLDGEIYGLYAGGEIPHISLINFRQVLTYSQSGFDEETVENELDGILVEMVKINHSPLKDTEDFIMPREVEIQLQTEPDLVDNSPAIHWRLANWTSYERAPLEADGSGTYQTAISPFPPDTIIEYYLSGENSAGHRRYYPPEGPLNPVIYRVGPDREAPEISYTSFPEWPANRLPAMLEILVNDNLSIQSVHVEAGVNGENFISRPAWREGPGRYRTVFDLPLNTGDVISYRVVARDGSRAGNTAISPPAGYDQFTIVDSVPVLIYDLDPNHSSGPVIAATCVTLDIENEYRTELPEHLMKYQSVFICLGMDQSSHRITQGEGKRIASYLDTGGRVYMEGGNTWFVDVPVTLHDYFPITGISDGDDTAGDLQGIAGSFAEGLILPYSGEGQFVDRITADTDGFEFLKNIVPEYPVGIGHTGNPYRTIGMSVEFGGIDSEAADRPIFLDRIVDFFATPPPSPTPFPEFTSTPVPTYTPSPKPGTELHMPRNYYSAGDPFWLTVKLINSGQPQPDLKLFVLLEIFGMYYFGPAWQPYPPAIDWWTIRILEPGSTFLDIIPPFLWPEDTGRADAITFMSALTDNDVTVIYGTIGTQTFGFGGN